eukprot:TRINITY_DN2511_c0_g1_i1.p1 TRINITY_DN2511_c0_g1~~TRINITY_DN2511_c0_g1_i1.p1  ORF type:complete len:894 (+),score=195.29 TRINITY_DN2511_c0_g1_i1:67-2748(+)
MSQVNIPHDLVTIPVRQHAQEIYQETLLCLPWVRGDQDAKVVLRGSGFKERYCVMDSNSISIWSSKKAWDAKDYTKQKMVIFLRDFQFFTPAYSEDGSNNSRQHSRAITRHSGSKWSYFGLEATPNSGKPSTCFMFSTQSTLVYTNWISFLGRSSRGEQTVFRSAMDTHDHWHASCQTDDVFDLFCERYPAKIHDDTGSVSGKYLPEEEPVVENSLLEMQYVEAHLRHHTILRADYELQENLVKLIHLEGGNQQRQQKQQQQQQQQRQSEKEPPVSDLTESDLFKELNDLFTPENEDAIPPPHSPPLEAASAMDDQQDGAAIATVTEAVSSTNSIDDLSTALGLESAQTSPTNKPDTKQLAAIVKQLIKKQGVVKSLKSSLTPPEENGKTRWKKLRQKLRFATDQEKKLLELEETINSPTTTPEKLTTAVTDMQMEINKEQTSKIKDLEEQLQAATLQLATASSPDVDLANNVADIKNQIKTEKQIQTENTELANIVLRDKLKEKPMIAKQLLDLQEKVTNAQRGGSDAVKKKLLELAAKVKEQTTQKSKQQTLKELVDAASSKMISDFETKEDKLITNLEDQLKHANERIQKLESHQPEISEVSPSVKWTGGDVEQVLKNQLNELTRLRSELSHYRSPDYASASAEVVRLNQKCRSLEIQLSAAQQGIPQADAQVLSKLKSSLQKEKDSYKLREQIFNRQIESLKQSKTDQLASVKHEIGNMRRSMDDLRQGLAAKQDGNIFEDSTEVGSVTELPEMLDDVGYEQQQGVVASIPQDMTSLLCLKLYSTSPMSSGNSKYHSNLWSDGKSLHQVSSFDDPLPLQSESGALYPTINRTWRFKGPGHNSNQVVLSLIVIPPPQPQYPLILGDISERRSPTARRRTSKKTRSYAYPL